MKSIILLFLTIVLFANNSFTQNKFVKTLLESEKSSTDLLGVEADCISASEFGSSSITESSATISWKDDPLMSYWTAKYGESGFSDSGTEIDYIYGASTTIYGLSASTTYDFYVKTVCSGITIWVGPYSFTTQGYNTIMSLPFEEDFEWSSTEWSSIDEDSDGNVWFRETSLTSAHSGSSYITSASYENGVGAYTPNNWYISPRIDLSSGTGTGALTLKYWVAALSQTWPSEHYKVVVSTAGGLDISNFTYVLYDEILIAGDASENNYFERTINLDAYAGETINIAWVHYDCTDMYQICLDDISVFESNTVDLSVEEILFPNNDLECTKTASEEVSVKLLNKGGASISNFDITLKVDENIIATETISSVIAPAGSLNYTYTAKADLSSLAFYNIEVEVVVADDADNTNDFLSAEVRSTDAKITITVDSDDQGNQAWYILNSNNDTIASHGGYQWDVVKTVDVCVFSNDCYKFNWLYSDQGENIVTVSYNDVVEDVTTATGDYSVSMIGGCTSGIDAGITATEVVVFPNPTSGLINIETDNKSSISIFNLLGERVLLQDLEIVNNVFDLSFLPNGSYLIKLISANAVSTVHRISLVK